MATGILRYGNILERKQWMMEGLLQKKSLSFWNGLIGNSAESVIYQKNDFNSDKGQNIIYDYSGNLAKAGFRGKEQAFGNAPSKLKFSDSLTMEFGRYTVDNGMEFDAAAIGDIDLSTHANSRGLLGDSFVRSKDQMFFDIGQGYLRGKAPSHIYSSATSISAMTSADAMSWDLLVDLETKAKTGIGLGGARRAPIKPFRIQDGRSVWLLVLDAWQIMDLLKDPKFQTIYQNAQVRGNGNELISHAVAQVGNLVIMEAGTAAGYSNSNLLFKQGVEAQGLRTIDENGTFSATGTAQAGVVASRGLLLGAGAFKYGMGKAPDYKFQESQDFGVTSESALVLTMNADKTILTAEVEDYKENKVADMDWGIVAVDTYNAALSA